METKTRTRRGSWVARVLISAVVCLGIAWALGGCSAQNPPTSTNATSSSSQASSSDTREFTDSVGRSVEVPTKIDKIAPSGSTATQVLLTIAPEKMACIASKLTDAQAKYLGSNYANLPVTGSAFGAKGDLNKEAVAASGAQILIDTGEVKDGMKDDLDTLQKQLGIPVVFIETKMDDYAAAYQKLGDLLGVQARGKELSDYCKKAYDDTVAVMKKIPDAQRVKVAYLVGDKATNTIAKNSYQGQVVDLVADNVADLGKVSGSGAGVQISMEQLANWNPQVILFSEDSGYQLASTDPSFQALDAITKGNFYEVPSTPWPWLNSPPTVNQVLGMQWLPRLLYPSEYPNDMYQTVAGYFKTFYHYDLSQDEFKQIAPHAEPKA